MSFQSLLAHFYERTGIEFTDNKDIVNKKVIRFYEEKGFTDYHDFFSAIKSEHGLYQDLVNLLTTSETYFYREPSQIEICIEAIKTKTSNIKILSAPCASGEEPYSLLIAMLEAKIDISKIQVYAIDINTQEIEKAKKGVFLHRRLHKLPQTLQDKYFNALDSNEFQILPELQKHVHFKQINLFDPFPSAFSDFDVIFSRNMLIYFDKKSQEQSEKIFYEKLTVGGLLFLGHADKIHHVTNLQTQTKKGTKFYIKES